MRTLKYAIAIAVGIFAGLLLSVALDYATAFVIASAGERAAPPVVAEPCR